MSRGVLSILGIYDEHEVATQLYIFIMTMLHVPIYT